MMKGNRLKFETMFDEAGNKSIKDETVSRIKFYEKEIRIAMPIMLSDASGGQEPPDKLITLAIKNLLKVQQ